MAYGYANLHEHNANNSGHRSKVASNSLAVKSGTWLKDSTAGLAVAGAGETIMGVSVTEKTFDSDNFTVKKEKVVFIPEPQINNTYLLPINGGTITLADQGSYYDITANGDVDGTSESTTTGQLQLVEYISATKGIFRVVNA